MYEALKKGSPVTLDNIDRFVDGAAVKRVGDITFPICKEVLDDMHLISEGKVCSTILKLYNEDAIVVEPAGALSIAALDDFANEIKYKTVVCIVAEAIMISIACRRSKKEACNMKDLNIIS
jgi:threonine dehydratase